MGGPPGGGGGTNGKEPVWPARGESAGSVGCMAMSPKAVVQGRTMCQHAPGLHKFIVVPGN
ncbi:hypothetical protein GCM10010519_77470 [Streptomyces lactacystinicus]